MKWCDVLIDLSAGVGRTGTFITVDYSMERMEAEGSVDIFNFVQQMRYKRNYMVQTAVSAYQGSEVILDLNLPSHHSLSTSSSMMLFTRPSHVETHQSRHQS